MCMCKVWKCVCSGEGKGGVVWCCVVNQEGGRRGGAWHGVANKTPSCTRARERDRERPHTSFLNIRLRSLPPPQRAAAAAWWSCLPPTNFINTPTPTHPHTSTPAHPLTPSAHPQHTLSHTLSSYIPLPPCSSRHGCLKNCRAANPSLQLHARMSRPSLIECEMLTLL